MASKTCTNCLFLKADHRDDWATHGQCRRLPPAITVWTGIDGYERPQANFKQHWPFMQPDDWCGEFKESDSWRSRALKAEADLWERGHQAWLKSESNHEDLDHRSFDAGWDAAIATIIQETDNG